MVELDHADRAEHPHVGHARARRAAAPGRPAARPRSWPPRRAQSPARSSPIEALATAQASGLPMKVGPVRQHRPSPRRCPGPPRACTARRPGSGSRRSAPCPRTSRPGVTPACSAAKSAPVRPKPVAISSKISSTPCARVTSRSTRRYAGWWKRIPPAPCTTGSTITAASSSRVPLDRSTSAVHVRRVGSDVEAGRRHRRRRPAGAARRPRAWCMPPSGSQTLIGWNVSPW